MPKTTVILVVVGILLVLAVGYLLTRGDSATVSVDTTPASEAEFTFIHLTAEIDPVTFTIAILSDPRFTVLEDIRTAILPEASGRPDPFAPIAGLVSP